MMMLGKKLMPLLASLCLFAAISSASAQDASPPHPAGPAIGEHCREEPAKCRERMQAWCKDHAERCEEMKKKHRQVREECKKDPQACEKKREEMREKRHQRMEEKCKQNPEK